MRRFFSAWVCVALAAAIGWFMLMGVSSRSAFAREPLEVRRVKDATGAQVPVVLEPKRVVTLAPSLGELVADLSSQSGGDLSRIVGVSDYTDYPPALAKVASIGPYSRFNLEKVVSLKPDLVLATLDGNPKDQVLRLRELGLPVVVVATATFADVEGSMRLVSSALGAAAEGEKMAARFATGLKDFKDRAAKRKGPRMRVLLQIGDDPFITVGGGTFLQDALTAIGADNLYADATAHYPRPALEDVTRRDPDRIVVLALGKDLKPFHDMAAKWSRFAKLKAVRAGEVKVLQGDAVLRPTLRLHEGLRLLERAVYGSK